MQATSSKVLCPRSTERANLLIESNKLHYATVEELKANGGVCRDCRKHIEKHGKAILAGRAENPAAITPYHVINVADDHAAYVGGEVEPIEDFDYDAVDKALGFVKEAEPDVQQKTGEVLRELMQFCYSGHKRPSAASLKTAALRLAIVCASVRPDLFENATQGQLAASLGRTKAAASKIAVLFRDKYKIKFARSRPDTGREHMRQARLKQGGVNRHNKQTGGGDAEGGGLSKAIIAHCSLPSDGTP